MSALGLWFSSAIIIIFCEHLCIYICFSCVTVVFMLVCVCMYVSASVRVGLTRKAIIVLRVTLISVTQSECYLGLFLICGLHQYVCAYHSKTASALCNGDTHIRTHARTLSLSLTHSSKHEASERTIEVREKSTNTISHTRTRTYTRCANSAGQPSSLAVHSDTRSHARPLYDAPIWCATYTGVLHFSCIQMHRWPVVLASINLGLKQVSREP